MSKDTAQPQKPAKPPAIPVYVVTEYNRLDHDTSFLGVYPDLGLAQQCAHDQLLTVPAAPEWTTDISARTGEPWGWHLYEPGATYNISRHQLAYSSDDAHRAAVLLMAAEILKAEFGAITVENELKVLRRVARQLAPDPEGDKAQEDRSWEG